METLLDQVDSVTEPGWTTYTVSWTSASAPLPSLGNGTLLGQYRQPAYSRQVWCRGILTWGSTTTGGTGGWRFSLPVTAHADAVTYGMVGATQMLDNGTIRRDGSILVLSTTTLLPVSDGGDVSPTVPWTWATGDVLSWCIAYEAAS